MKKNLKFYRPEILGVIVCLGLGIASGYVTNSGDSEWYNNLVKPSFTAPSWVFGPVWTVLYIMMGVALAKIWKGKDMVDGRLLLLIFSFHFLLNLAWSPLFFYFHRVDLAFYDISLLWLSLCTLIILAGLKNRRSVFFLLLPYLGWVSFAWFLNHAIYQLNVV